MLPREHVRLLRHGDQRQGGLACKTNVSDIPAGQDITLRPLNHFPVIKDLVVDMEPFFKKYEEAMPYFEAREAATEPSVIRPDTPERQAIGMSTDCIACGCCVSSCTMCHYHEGYAGPAALNRAFTLLADKRDGLFEERLDAVLASCYNCRTEFNCTEVCPKGISGTRAIKYIQRLALSMQKRNGNRKRHRLSRLLPYQRRVPAWTDGPFSARPGWAFSAPALPWDWEALPPRPSWATRW